MGSFTILAAKLVTLNAGINGAYDPVSDQVQDGNVYLLNAINVNPANVGQTNTGSATYQPTGPNPWVLGGGDHEGDFPLSSNRVFFGYTLTDAIISVDGGPAISFNSLPAGFTPTSAKLTVYFVANTGEGEQGDQLILQLGPSSTPINGTPIDADTYTGPCALTLSYPLTSPFPSMLDILNNGFGIDFTCSPAGIALGSEVQYLAAQITGTYGIVSFRFALQNQNPANVGDKITVTSSTGGLDGIQQIQLSFTNPATNQPEIITIDAGSPFIIIHQPNQFIFYLPYGFGTYAGPVNITLIGNGVQFSGSVALGTLEILFADTSGIYVLDKDQTSDLLYIRVGYTTNPQTTMITLDEEDPALALKSEENTNFHSSQAYPTAVLSETEDIESDQFSIIGIPQVVTITESVEIPSPFAQTGFFP